MTVLIMCLRRMNLTLVRTENEFMPELIGTRGFGGQGVSKISSGIQAGRLGYQLGKSAYKKWLDYILKSKSRSIGTATGSGIGIGGGLTAIRPGIPQRQRSGYQFSKERFRYLKHNRRRNKHNCCTVHRCC